MQLAELDLLEEIIRITRPDETAILNMLWFLADNVTGQVSPEDETAIRDILHRALQRSRDNQGNQGDQQVMKDLATRDFITNQTFLEV